jgi:GAF domain-containing protein
VQTNPGADQEPGETLISGSALEDLLQRSAQTMIDRFQFYFTGIYLTEEDPDTVATATGTLVLKAACLDGQRGAEIGQRIAAKGRRVLVEGPNPLQARRGAVAVAASSKRPRLSLDVSLDPLFSPDPDLPETRSQICLPLLIGSKVIGVLDIQTRAGSLSSEEVPILQNLADELAAAIQNIHLAEQVGQANQEIQQAYGRFTQQAWRTLTGARMGTGEPGDAANALGFRASQQSGSLSPIFAGEIAAASQPESLAFADQPGAQSGDLAYLENVQVRLAEDGATLLSVPVKVRQQAIAMIELRFASTTSETAGSPRVSEETLATLNDVAARLGLVLESGRLLQEAQRLAAREQQINLISTQMRGASKLESILQTTVRELGKALGASRAVIQLREEGRHE